MQSPASHTTSMWPDVGTTPLWRKVFSIGVTLGLLAWMASSLNLTAFATSLSQINHVAYVAFMFFFVLALLMADSAAIARVYVKYVCDVKYNEILVLRGASYLPSLINYHVGQAWLTWYVARAYRAKIARVTGCTLLNYATMFGSLAILSAASYPLSGGRMPWLEKTLLILGAAALAYAAFIVAKPRFLRHVPGLETLFDAGLVGHLSALLWRLPHMIVLFLGMWLPFRFFDVQIPMGDALAYVPILMLVGALPITPQGVGTRDLIALNLLASYAPAGKQVDRITAATFCWAVTITLIEGAIAPAFLVYARRLFAKAATKPS